jgi:hypothetical protein
VPRCDAAGCQLNPAAGGSAAAWLLLVNPQLAFGTRRCRQRRD